MKYDFEFNVFLLHSLINNVYKRKAVIVPIKQ